MWQSAIIVAQQQRRSLRTAACALSHAFSIDATSIANLFLCLHFLPLFSLLSLLRLCSRLCLPACTCTCCLLHQRRFCLPPLIVSECTACLPYQIFLFSPPLIYACRFCYAEGGTPAPCHKCIILCTAHLALYILCRGGGGACPALPLHWVPATLHIYFFSHSASSWGHLLTLSVLCLTPWEASPSLPACHLPFSLLGRKRDPPALISCLSGPLLSSWRLHLPACLPLLPANLPHIEEEEEEMPACLRRSILEPPLLYATITSIYIAWDIYGKRKEVGRRKEEANI